MYKIPITIQRVAYKDILPVYPLSHLVSPPNGVAIVNGSTTGYITNEGTLSIVTYIGRDPSLDITYNCYARDRYNNPNQGVLFIIPTILGTWINENIVASALDITTTILGTYSSGILIPLGLLEVTLSLRPGDIDTVWVPFTSPAKANWIQWSNIGALDFTVGRDNVAGERPLDWKGSVYAIKKLNNKIIVYGANGVSILVPAGTTFSLNTIYRIGLKSKLAVTGDETKQFFVDNAGKLWRLSDSLKLLDYSEYLASMNSNIALQYDSLNNLVYICDGSVGYVYDVVADSLGKCQQNITGINYQSGVQYVVASSAITTDPFEICTDIYDLGSRAGKTVFSLEFGTDVVTALYAAIDYRRDKAAAFIQTPWYLVSPGGRVFITAWGREFRIWTKTLEYKSFELDYIKVNGVADAY